MEELVKVKLNRHTGQIPNTVVTRLENFSAAGKDYLSHILTTFFHHPIEGKAYACLYYSVPNELMPFMLDETQLLLNDKYIAESFRNQRFGHIKLPKSLARVDRVLGERIYVGFSTIDDPIPLSAANMLASYTLAAYVIRNMHWDMTTLAENIEMRGTDD